MHVRVCPRGPPCVWRGGITLTNGFRTDNPTPVAACAAGATLVFRGSWTEGVKTHCGRSRADCSPHRLAQPLRLQHLGLCAVLQHLRHEPQAGSATVKVTMYLPSPPSRPFGYRSLSQRAIRALNATLAITGSSARSSSAGAWIDLNSTWGRKSCPSSRASRIRSARKFRNGATFSQHPRLGSVLDSARVTDDVITHL